jgi:Ribbon-helix-helix protein, copG family
MPTRRTGPRGGRTTVTAGGLLKKTIYLDAEEWKALRRKRFEEDRPVSEIVRELIRRGLGLDDSLG